MWFDLGLGVEAGHEFSTKSCKLAALVLGYDGVALGRPTSGPGISIARQVQDLRPGDVAQLNAMRHCTDFTRPAYMRNGELTQFTRITLVAESLRVAEQLRPGNSELRLEYDIVAVRPCSAEIFQLACLTLDVDLIVIDPLAFPFSLAVETASAAMARGVHFELCYRPAVADDDDRIYTRNIAASREIVKALKGRGLVISSGAGKPSELRDPYAVISIATTYFGLKEQDAKAAISTRPEAVIRHGIRARTSGVKLG